MATKLSNLSLELAHLQAIQQYIPNFKEFDKGTFKKLADSGLIQVSTCFEHAIANVSDTEVISEDYADLSCGSDAKLCTVRTSNYGKSYSAPVGSVRNKTGDLLVQCYERKYNKFYYFRIPHTAYKHIPSTSNVEIPFSIDGTPRRNNNCFINWWKYECASFTDMCKTMSIKNIKKESIWNKFFEEV